MDAIALRDVLIRLTGDSRGARKSIGEVKSDLKDVDGTTAEADVTVNGVEAVTARLDELRARLEKVDHTTASAKVKLDTAVASAELDKFEARLYRALQIEDPGRRNVALNGLFGSLSNGLDRVEKRTHHFAQDLETDLTEAGKVGGGALGAITTGAEAAASGLSAAATGAKGFLSGVPIIGNALGGITGVVASLAELGPVGLLLIPIVGFLAAAIGGALVQAAVAAAAALTALISVVAAAIAAAAALTVAFAAIAIPVGILAVGAIAKLTKTLLGSKDASAKAQTAADSLAQAHRAQAQASVGLADAQRNASEQRVAALQDERAAVQAVAQAELDRERAAEGRVNARLDLRQARLDLKTLRTQTGTAGASSSPLFAKLTNLATDPSTIAGALKGVKFAGGSGKSEEQQQIDLLRAIERVREAKTGVKSADLTAKTAATGYANALARQNQYVRQGLTAYKPYADALRQTAKAQDALATATERTAKAQRANAKAQGNLAGATGGVGGTIKAFTSAISSTIGPAIDAIFAGAGKGLGAIVAVLPQLQSGFTRLGQAIGDGLATLGRLFASPTFVSSFKTFTSTAADLVRHFATPFVARFATLLLSIANAALPHLVSGLKHVGDKFGVFTEGAKKGDKVKGVVDDLYDSFKSVVNFADAVLGALVAIFSGGRKSGQKLLDKLTEIINKFTDGLGKPKGREALKKFFADGVTFAKTFSDALQTIIDFLKILSDTAKTAKNATKNILGLPGTILDTLEGKFSGAIHRIGQGRAAGGLVEGPSHPLDSILTPLTGGEFIMRRAAVQAIGLPALEALNAGLSLPMPAVGAWAPAPSPSAIDNSRSYGGHTIQQHNNYHEAPGNLQHHQAVSAQQLADLARAL